MTARDELIIARFEEVKLLREIRVAKIKIVFWTLFMVVYFAMLFWIIDGVVFHERLNYFPVVVLLSQIIAYRLRKQYKERDGFVGFDFYKPITFCLWFGYYDAWPDREHGTNYWLLEFCFRKRIYNFKLDFWRPIDNGGWYRVANPDGSESIKQDELISQLFTKK